MWTRSDLKEKGRKNIKNNYWRILGVILICNFVLNGFNLNINVGNNVTAYNQAHMTVNKVVDHVGSRFGDKSQTQMIKEFVDEVASGKDSFDIAGEFYKPTKGVLAGMYNNIIGAKSFFAGTLNGVNEMVFQGRFGTGTVMLISAFVMLLFWIFIGMPLTVGKCRYMLETRTYYDTQIGRMLFVWRVQRGRRTAWTMFKRQMFMLLWILTVVGGPIKYYQYKLIPYILAENPDITDKEAFEMSKNMMYGQKWNAFKLDVSFLGWYVINILTFGILGWALIKPYRETTYTELYITLREYAKEAHMANNDLLFDKYIGLSGRDGTYPIYDYPLSERVSKKWITLDYERSYSIANLIMMFFIFSFIGWIWEVGIHLYEDGIFVNRGTMYGPWLPIYGSGGVLIIVLLRRFAKNPGLTFALAVVLCGIVEYGTATYLWEVKGAKWWDYSGYFLNLNGRICAEGLIIFGIGGLAFIYILGPVVDTLLNRVSKKVIAGICVGLLICFCIDLAYSHFHPNMGAGITDYGSNEVKRIEVNEKYSISDNSYNFDSAGRAIW